MNSDHFRFLEADDLELPADPPGAQPRAARTDLYASLITDFEDLPRRRKIDEGDYAVVNVAPAVVPNPYTPAFRIFSYNVSGAPTRAGAAAAAAEGPAGVRLEHGGEEGAMGKDRKHGHHRGGKGDKKSGCKEGRPWADTWRCQLRQIFSMQQVFSLTDGLRFQLDRKMAFGSAGTITHEHAVVATGLCTGMRSAFAQ